MSHALRLALAVLVVCAAPLAGQAPVSVDSLGPQPGAAVPDFSAVDQAGTTRTLASILGPKGALLVFSRSADW